MKFLIFVYGSLKAGFHNHRRLDGSTFIGPAKTCHSYSLHSMGTFPAMAYAKIGQGSHIRGELYEVDDHGLAAVDQLEGHPHFYCRKEIPVAHAVMGHTLKAWCYFIQRDMHNQPVGDTWTKEMACTESSPSRVNRIQ